MKTPFLHMLAVTASESQAPIGPDNQVRHAFPYVRKPYVAFLRGCAAV